MANDIDVVTSDVQLTRNSARLFMHSSRGDGAGPDTIPAMTRLGLDVFSLRSQGWTPFDHLDFCARWGVRVAHYSEIRLLGGLDPEHLRRVREHADARGIAL